MLVRCIWCWRLSSRNRTHHGKSFFAVRDSIWQLQRVGTDGIDTEWKRAVKASGMEVWYALSPQAKGKIERPYR